MKTAERDIKEKLISAAKKCQQNFYELLSDWNSYDQKRPQCLKNFIGIALFGPPKIDDLLANRSFSGKNWEDEIFPRDPHQQKKISNIYEKIIRHGTENTTKQEIMCGIIYNVIFEMRSIEALKKILETGKCFSEENMARCLQPVPIFKVLKNSVKIQNGKRVTKKFAVYYIDDCERVYKNWNDYLGSNFLPECIMVSPKGGEYQGDDKKQWSGKMSYVWTEIHESPACKTKTINAISSINTFVSLGCAGVGVAAVFNPVGATFVALSAVGMGLSGLWSMSRSSHELADRHLHEQSISIKYKDGFSGWFGIASSALAVVSSGGTMLLSQAIKNGTSLSTVAKLAHGSIQIGSIAANGVNAGFADYNIYEPHLERKVSAQDALNLVASLLLFSNSAVDLNLSNSILEQNPHFIRDFEHSLRSSRHRKEFRRMVRNSTSFMSNSNGSPEQIIRRIARISHKDVFSTSIISNQKNFSLKGIEVSSSDGSITIDGKPLLRPADFVKKFQKKVNGIQPIAVPLTINFGTHDIIFERVLKHFLARYGNNFQGFKPTLNQFSPFLSDVRRLEKSDVIFAKMLLIGVKLVWRITNKRYFVNNILAEIVDFLWEFIQANFRERIRPLTKSKVYRESLMKVVISVHTSVENNLDDWIDSFKDYLKIKFKLIKEKVECNMKERMYQLHVL
ncbi:uncharacterized protein LOC117171251 [Belonocnema kinseyi]|uniref:uncharacterized protein LOC117171251 n=1 Tax=Belonocnema kinseyi TaxID=2817044 RepID=UPI00143CF0CD|nr:uncharacterized protein LOC117171251 [Belonocnema kinseyi]